ncbi:XrtV sorting system accessory protein [Phenylobacterium sp.]|uniref:XrtV sorting system accessory protein n=1 Tax=Phenylobacterium sp. TaxID=1871053 RepID=UPI00122BAE64|nr:XrtV sorting system accessory protein [Phenylobacterium sp.]THD65114.1 MAG: hypothetical protein E8A49_00100 [Phenylobacterium sp.]
MTAICEWLALAMLAGVGLLGVQRLLARRLSSAGLFQYIPPSMACLIAAFVALRGRDALALVLLAVVLAYVGGVLKPFGFKSQP